MHCFEKRPVPDTVAVVFGTVAVRTLVVVVAAVRVPTAVVAVPVTTIVVAVHTPAIAIVHVFVLAVVGTAVAERVRLPAAHKSIYF